MAEFFRKFFGRDKDLLTPEQREYVNKPAPKEKVPSYLEGVNQETHTIEGRVTEASRAGELGETDNQNKLDAIRRALTGGGDPKKK